MAHPPPQQASVRVKACEGVGSAEARAEKLHVGEAEGSDLTSLPVTCSWVHCRHAAETRAGRPLRSATVLNASFLQPLQHDGGELAVLSALMSGATAPANYSSTCLGLDGVTSMHYTRLSADVAGFFVHPRPDYDVPVPSRYLQTLLSTSN